MFQSLKSKGVEVPFGFAVSSFAYFYNLEANSINREIRNALNGLNVGWTVGG
jgi:phosphoenolpyruvate synthase/pyruvate phosphate dikinase